MFLKARTDICLATDCLRVNFFPLEPKTARTNRNVSVVHHSCMIIITLVVSVIRVDNYQVLNANLYFT